MKKTLIALAVAALPMAAQADSSNVTVYGQMNVSLDFLRTASTTSGADTSLNRVSSNSSRIGFKGTEDLGNGMAANFQIEQQIGVESDSTTAGAGVAMGGHGLRNTYVGLSGKSWGEIRVGRHDTPYKMATGNLDIFADTAADYNSIIGANNVTGSVDFDERAANAIAYISPNLSGFTAAIAWVAANELGTTNASNPSAYSLAGMYANGPIFASLAYERYANTANVSIADNTDKATKIGFGYNFGDAKVGFIWESNDTTEAASAKDRTAYGVNVAYTMGSNVLKAAYLVAKDGNDAADTGAKNLSLGVDHNMSKRTAVYALYTKTSNNTGASYNVGGGQGGDYGPGLGEDPSILSFGMKHSF